VDKLDDVDGTPHTNEKLITWMKWEHLDENDEFHKTWHWMWMKPMKMAKCYVTNEINDMDETRPYEN
jgi:hypothetical protein